MHPAKPIASALLRGQRAGDAVPAEGDFVLARSVTVP
jgi:hypothetical protein